MWLCATVCAVAVGCAQPPKNKGVGLDHILALNAQARGGSEAIESVQAARLELRIEEPSFTVTGTYVATRSGHVRVDIFDGDKRVFTEALGPGGGWQWYGGEEQSRPLTAEGIAALRRGLVGNLYGLYEWPGHGYRMALAESPAPGDSLAYWVVVATEPNGFAKQLWIDRESHLVVREHEVSALHPDIDATKREQYTLNSKWGNTHGVLAPVITKRIDAVSGETLQTATVLSRDHFGPGQVPPEWSRDGYFKPPVF
jgi:hypothetical protein